MSLRQGTGVTLLTVVAVAVLANHSVFGPSVVGQPTAEWPRPLLVGSCVGPIHGTITDVVPCGQPHQGEVTKIFVIADTLRLSPAARSDLYCRKPTVEYMGLVDNPEQRRGPNAFLSGWFLPQPQYGLEMMDATDTDSDSDSDSDNGARWVACTVHPQQPIPNRGSVRDAGNTAARPAAFGTCGISTGPDWLISDATVSCAEPHQWETLGQTWVDADGQLTSEQRRESSTYRPYLAALTRQCTRYAEKAIGTTDPTDHGVLKLGVGLYPMATGVETHEPRKVGRAHGSHARNGTAVIAVGKKLLRPGGEKVAVSCRIATVDPAQELGNSMIGHGTLPPPLVVG